MPFYTYRNSQWSKIKNAWVYVNSAWKPIKNAWVYISSSNSWKLFYTSTPVVIPTLSTPTNLNVKTHNPTTVTNNFVANWSAVTNATSYTYSVYDNTNNTYIYQNQNTASTETPTLSVGAQRNVTVYVKANASGYNSSTDATYSYDCGPIPTGPTGLTREVSWIPTSLGTVFIIFSGGTGHGREVWFYKYSNVHSAGTYSTGFFTVDVTDYKQSFSGNPVYSWTLDTGSAYFAYTYNYTFGRNNGNVARYYSPGYAIYYYLKTPSPSSTNLGTTSSTITNAVVGNGPTINTIQYSFNLNGPATGIHYWEVSLQKYNKFTGAYIENMPIDGTSYTRYVLRHGQAIPYSIWSTGSFFSPEGSDSIVSVIGQTLIITPGFRYWVVVYAGGWKYDSTSGFYIDWRPYYLVGSIDT